MKNKERSYKLLLEDIQIAMSRIMEYTEGYDLELFMQDHKTVDAVIRNFEVIGEAARNLNEEIKRKYPDVPWDEMYYLRNKVSHEYFGIDHNIIWDITHNYLPENKKQIDQIISNEK